VRPASTTRSWRRASQGRYGERCTDAPGASQRVSRKTPKMGLCPIAAPLEPSANASSPWTCSPIDVPMQRPCQNREAGMIGVILERSRWTARRARWRGGQEVTDSGAVGTAASLAYGTGSKSPRSCSASPAGYVDAPRFPPEQMFNRSQGLPPGY